MSTSGRSLHGRASSAGGAASTWGALHRATGPPLASSPPSALGSGLCQGALLQPRCSAAVTCSAAHSASASQFTGFPAAQAPCMGTLPDTPGPAPRHPAHHHHHAGCPPAGAGRWPAPTRNRLVRASAVASPAAPHPSSSAPPPARASNLLDAAAVRPPSPGHNAPASSYFDGFCPDGTSECSVVWEQLRWCSSWQQMRQVYDNLVRAEVAVAAAAAAGQAAAAAGPTGAGLPSSASVDVTAAAVAAATSGGASPAAARRAGSSSATVPGLLGRDETYAVLLQLQDFYHLRLDEQELGELQEFRGRLVRDLSAYVRRLDAEQLEALCCASAVSGKRLTREHAVAVQERLLKILSITTKGNGTNGSNGSNGTNGNGNGNGAPAAAAAAGRRRPMGAAGGFHVLTPALNIIFALYDHGFLPQVSLLQAVFRQAVDHLSEVTRSQWHALHGLARRFRFLVDDTWLEDLHAGLRDPLACATDFGRLASILGCIASFTINTCMEALDTRVLVVVEAIERRFDEGRSLMTAHQLCVFAALLIDMQSPFRSKWLGIAVDHLGSCRSHLAGLSPATLVLAVELVLRSRGWEDHRLLAKLLRQLFSSYAKHPATSLRATSNCAGCPPRTASRIITSPAGGTLAGSAPTLAAMAAAAAWDVEVGGVGGAASPPHDLVTLVDWIASKVPTAPGPERTEVLEFLHPLVADLVEGGRRHLPTLEPRRIPGLLRAVALLGYKPSRAWLAEAFEDVAAGADTLGGGELVAMLRLSHAQALPLPHATLEAVCCQHARILPLMRAVDLQRLLECWVADRYIPSQEQLEGYLDAVCWAFDIDLAALKAASSASASLACMSLSTTDADDAAAAAAAPAADASAPGGGGGGRRSSRAMLDLEPQRTVSGGVSAGAADGVAGKVRRPARMPGLGAAAEALLRSTAAADAPAAASVAAAPAATKPRPTALGSLDSRPRGSRLQPAEAQSMLALLEQYRALLLEVKRSDLLIVLNAYRASVTAALHDMRKAGDAKPAAGSRLLRAALRGGVLV